MKDNNTSKRIAYSTKCWFGIQLTGMVVALVIDLIRPQHFVFEGAVGIVAGILWPLMSWFWIYLINCAQFYWIGWNKWWKLCLIPAAIFIVGIISHIANSDLFDYVFLIPMLLDTSILLLLIDPLEKLFSSQLYYLYDIVILLLRSLIAVGILWLMRYLTRRKFGNENQ